MANKSRKFVNSCCIFLLVVYLDILSHGFVDCRRVLDEYRMLPKAKGTIKTIESPEDGVVIDCVDFWKQRAFDNPITKKLQLMEPTNYSNSNTFQTKNESKLPKIFHTWHKYGECPKGTIPIRRTRSNNATTIHRGRHRNAPKNDEYNHEYAIAHYVDGEYNGASAVLNVWNPYVVPETNEFSVAQIWVASNRYHQELVNTVEAGWNVNPDGDAGGTGTTFFTECTSDGYSTIDCRYSFVQESQFLTYGCDLQPYSTYDGIQYELKVEIERDPQTERWNLKVNNDQVGYWPFNLFTTLRDGAEVVEWGGEIINDWKDDVHTNTQMGSGHLPDAAGFGRAAYIRSMMVKDVNHNWNMVDKDFLYSATTFPRCYNVLIGDDLALGHDGPDTTIYYGGPGGENCNN